jgi:hypothetical protein
MKKLIFLLVITATQFVNLTNVSAQNVDSTTVFGYAVPKPKLDSNGNPKHVFKPAFKRLGLTAGVLLPFNGSEAGGTSGFRFEYGLSNKTSILLDFQGNNSQDSTFSGGQGALIVRTMPFKAHRLQPYFGAGWALGGGDGGGRGGRDGNGKDGRYHTQTIDTDSTSDGTVKNFALVQAGVNYIVFRRVIASLEGNYQLQVGGTNAQKLGGASIKFGLAYQFGKRK